LYSRLSHQDSVIDAKIAWVKQLRFNGWFLPIWIREKNLVQTLQLSQQVQSLLATDLKCAIHKCFPLTAAQQKLETYVNHMSTRKILLVANPQEVMLDN
jgi:hypothetical protein